MNTESEPIELFADWQPDEPGQEKPKNLSFRSARFTDVPEIARVRAERHGLEPKAVIKSLAGRFIAEEYILAMVEKEVVGYGRRTYFTPPEEAPENCVPEGWYLMGLCVSPEYRRAGIGSDLTRFRARAVSFSANRVYYFVNHLNKPSVALHEKLGFKEIARNVWYPDVTFSNEGEGVLFSQTFKK